MPDVGAPGDAIADLLSHPPALLAPCILLLLAERACHGYELGERLREFGLARKSKAPVYRELWRLESAGLVRSDWAATQIRGPSRRIYELTHDGEAALAGCIGGALELTRTLEHYVGRARAVSPRRPPTAQGRKRPGGSPSSR